MLTNLMKMMIETILRGQQNANDLKTLSENQATLTVSDPKVVALVDHSVDYFSQLSSLISSDSYHDLNSNDDNNMLARSSAKGKEVATFIEHKTNESPDPFSWRKYGQKTIKNFTHLRRYYKCTKCEARKKVQMLEDNPLMSRTYYKGVHTCEAVVSSNHVNEEENSYNMSQFHSQIQTMANSIFLSPPQIGHQETVVANSTVHQNFGFESSFLPYGDEGFLPLENNVYQGTAVANNVMNQVYGDQFLCSESTFQAYGDSMHPFKDNVGQETVVANTVHQNYCFPSLPQIGHQETVVANSTVHQNFRFESPFLPYGDEGFLPLENNVYQGTAVANNVMNQVYGDQFLRSESTFQAYGDSMPPFKDNVGQETVVANNAMDQAYDE